MKLMVLSLILILAELANAISVEEQELITFDLVKALEIRSCVRFRERSTILSNLDSFKKFPNRKIPTVFLAKEKFLQFIINGVDTYWRTAIIIETDTLNLVDELLQTLKKAGEEGELEKFTWLIFLEETTQPNYDQLSIPFDCEFMVISSTGENNYDLIEVYKMKNVKFTHKYGTWSDKSGLSYTKKTLYERRSDLSNVSVVYATTLPLKGSCAKQVITCCKKEVLYDIRNYLNLDIKAMKKRQERHDDNEYADIYDSTSVFHHYFYRFDTFGPLFKAYLNWYIKAPEVEAHQDYYIRPFAVDLWLSLLLITIIGSLVAAIIGLIIRRLEKQSALPQLIDNIFTALECFCNQDGGQTGEYFSFRVSLFTFRLAALFIIPAYSAVIISFLAVRIPRVPFHNLEEFIQNGEYFIVRKDDAIFPRLYFDNSADPLIKTIKKNFLKALTDEEGIDLTCREKYAMILPNIFWKKADCYFYQMKDPITYFFMGIELSKDSELRNILNHYLTRSYSSGIINKLEGKIAAVPLKDDDGDGFLPVKIDQMVQVLMFAPVGAAFGIFILLLEIGINYICLTKRKRSF